MQRGDLWSVVVRNERIGNGGDLYSAGDRSESSDVTIAATSVTDRNEIRVGNHHDQYGARRRDPSA